MKIFGTVQPFVESQEKSFKIGRLVANYEFFKALFKFSDFDEFHIFCPTYANCKLTQEKIAEENISNSQKSKIKIFHITSLKKSLRQNNYYVFHLGGWGFFYPGLVHLRNIHSPELFPITGITHSLNAKESSFHSLKLCTAPVMPFDSVICTSSCGKKVLQNLFAEAQRHFPDKKYSGRLDVIPLGIDDAYKNIPDRSESRKILAIEQDSFTILLLGRLEADNNMDIVPFLNTIRCFAEKNDSKKITLIIAGGCDSQSHNFIKNLLREHRIARITKLFINFEDNLKTHLYRASNVYAAPIDNFQETFGISVVEAMAHQCTAVISDFNGYSEIVDDGINGIKIPTYWADITKEFAGVSEIMNFPTWQLLLSQSVAVDSDKMLNAFQELLDNPEKCNAIGMEAKKKVEQKYFWSNIIKQYCSLWDELAKQAASYSADIKKTENPWEVDFWKVFSHYPSSILSEKTRLSISTYGKEVIDSNKIPVPYSDIAAAVIIPDLVKIALKTTQQNIITIEELKNTLKKYAEISDSIAVYYILWMVKYNLLKILE